MLKATIFALPSELQSLNGREAAMRLAKRATGNHFELFDDRRARLVPKGCRRLSGVPVGGTVVLDIHVDAARQRILLDCSTQKAEADDRRGSALTVAQRVGHVHRLAEGLGLDELPGDQSPVETSRVAVPSLLTQDGVCTAREIARVVANCGFKVQSAIRVAVVHAAKERPLAERLWRTLAAAMKGHPALATGMTLLPEMMPVAKAVEFLRAPASKATAEKRDSTVLVFALPPGGQALEEGSPQITELTDLRRWGVPVVVSRPDKGAPGAANSLLYKVKLAKGHVPYGVDHDFRADGLIGIDAAHDHGGDSRWAAVLLDREGRILAHATRLGPRDESFNGGAACDVLNAVFGAAAAVALKRIVVHRDGRSHKSDAAETLRLAYRHGLTVEYVPVSKQANVVLYRQAGADAAPAELGDALVERDDSGAWAFTAHGSRAQYANALRIWGMANTTMDKALPDLCAAALLPTLGLFQSTRLPATTYWADLLSKRDLGSDLIRCGFMEPECQSRTTRARPQES